jgi:hypothetical protein
MAKQVISIGAAPNDGTGDPLRTAMSKSNDNFSELYNLADHPQGYDFQGSTRRIIMRGGYLCIDKTLSVTGFAGTQGVDWDEIVSY